MFIVLTFDYARRQRGSVQGSQLTRHASADSNVWESGIMSELLAFLLSVSISHDTGGLREGAGEEIAPPGALMPLW